jgi:putative ABC transport system permease protein
MEAEMQLHLEMQIEQNLAAGMAAEEARYAARRQFGNQTWLKEASREMWRLNSLEALIQDLRYGARMLLKKPGFTSIAVLTLALGIGANTAIFSVINAFLLRPLPYSEPDRLVMVGSQERGNPIGVSFLDYRDWRAQSTVFEDLAFFNLRWNANVELGSETETLSLTFGTPNLFSLLRVRPLIGRDVTPEDSQAGAKDTVLISHNLWLRRFGADPGILGRELTIDGSSLTIIGVMPAGFRFPFQTDLWWMTDIYFNRENRGMRIDQVIGRLNPEANAELARAEIKQIAGRLAQQYPETNAEVISTVTPLRDAFVGKMRGSFLLLLAASGFLLSIACANVANLLLVRGAARQRELAIRLTLGAGRRKLIGQLMTESLLLSLLGGVGGVFLAYWGLNALVVLIPGELLPFWIDIEIDLVALGFTLAVSLLTGIVFGLLPAWHAGNLNLNESLKDGSPTAGARSRQVRELLVIAEIALAMVLLTGAGLMIRSLARLQGVQPGFNPEAVLMMEVNPTYHGQMNVEIMAAKYQKLLRAVAEIPGVVAVGANYNLPFVEQMPRTRANFTVEGQSFDEQKSNPVANQQNVSPDYFRVMQIPLIQRRFFDERDALGAPDVAIINRRLAERFWPGEDPIGRRLALGAPEDREPMSWTTIVGVVGDVKHEGLGSDAGYDLYFSCYQTWNKRIYFVARTQGDPARLAETVKKEIWRVTPDTGLFNVQPLMRVVSNSIWQSRLWGLLLSVFSAVAAAMAAAGIYGVMSYSVAQRMREIAIRQALGAQASDVLKLILRQGLNLTAPGLALGLAVSLGLTRWMETLLFGVRPTDPLTFTVITAVLASVALLACWIPARRAANLDPLLSLRVE